MNAFHSCSILLVEDNLADVRLTVELLREARLANRLKVISDGLDAISFLRGAGQGGVDALPDLVLLDLDLPGTNGREVLSAVRSTPGLAHIPVFILTSSATQRELVQEEGLEADGYLEKPIDLAAFLAAAIRHERFWLELVTVPHA